MAAETTRTRPVVTPEILGPYRVERLLGRGGMGDVLQAWDPRLERRVAIKYIQRRLAGNQECRSRLLQEARVIASLHHPAIVQIFDILEPEDGGQRIVMEFVDGPTLKDLLESGPLEIESAVRLGLAIIRGLGAAHERGILHRDVKAENVMLTPEGEVKILDFGLSKRLRGADDMSITNAGCVLGTARVMSPEQADCKDLDCRSDLFSFGVLLYEMVTGESPFRGSTAVDTILKVRCEPHPDIRKQAPRLPEELSQLIDQLLEKNRDHRPQEAGHVATALESMARGMADDSALLRGRILALRKSQTPPASAAVGDARRESPSAQKASTSTILPTSILARRQTRRRTDPTGLRGTGRASARRRRLYQLATSAALICVCLAGAWWLRALEADGPSGAAAAEDRSADAHGPVSHSTNTAVSSTAFTESRTLTSDDPQRGPSPRLPADSRVVVLPMSNHGSAENDYFAAGLTSELVRELTYRQEVEVVSFRLSRHCGTDSWSIPDLGSELDVTHVLEGDVAWQEHASGDAKLRVGLQLIRVRDGRVVMARSFDRTASDILRVQDEIADFVSRDLGSQLVYGIGRAAADSTRVAETSDGDSDVQARSSDAANALAVQEDARTAATRSRAP